MNIKEFVTKYNMTCVRFCKGCGISRATYWNLINGLTKPYQRTAESIEKFTRGFVTVKELRGCDDREDWFDLHQNQEDTHTTKG